MERARAVKGWGYTLVELMVTLVIVAIALAAGLITLRGYLPKQRLIATQSGLADLLQRAQSEAGARVRWTCVKFVAVDDKIRAELWVDENDQRAAGAASCGQGGTPAPQDFRLVTYPFRRKVAFPTSPTSAPCNGTVRQSDVIWFDTQGFARTCQAPAPPPRPRRATRRISRSSSPPKTSRRAPGPARSRC